MKAPDPKRDLDLSVIIPVVPGADPSAAIEAVRRSVPKGMSAEVLAVTATHPSRQRNLAANRARGRVLWFLDHDAIAAPRTAGLLLASMVRRGAVAAGGPNLAAAPRTRFEAAAAAVIASPVGSPLVSARYGSRADDGPAGERALILCNLAIDREAFLSAGGFDPRLYPNEENALLHRLQRRGALAVHVHDAPVRKPRPGTLGRFVTESFRYGRGRLEEVWVAPGRGDGIFLAVFLAALAGLAEGRAHPSIPAAYAVVCLVEGLRLARNGRPGVPGRAVVCAGLLVLRHAAYGAGMCWGALTGWRKRTVRWKPMNAVVRRYRVGSNGIRPPDTVSCRIGSMAKEAAANA